MYSTLRFIPSLFIKSNPIHLTLFLTKRCNARCPFCFYSNLSDKSNAISEVTLEEIKGLSRSMGSLLWLAFSGGEIFLRDDLIEISRIFYENNKPSIMLYPTNGILGDKIIQNTVEILKNCPESVVVVKLSIDGLKEKHDSLRGVRGSFDKALETYEKLSPLLDKYHNFELGINTVFCSENQDDMDGIIDFVKGLRMIKTHTISLIRGDVRDKELKRIDISKYLSAIGRLEEDFRKGQSPVYGFKGARIKAAQDVLQRKLIYKTINENRKMLPCYAGRLNLVVADDGGVYPCENFKEAFLMGNIRDSGGDIKKVVQSERAKKVLSSIENCFCTHECYMMTNILFNPRMYPGLAREFFL